MAPVRPSRPRPYRPRAALTQLNARVDAATLAWVNGFAASWNRTQGVVIREALIALRAQCRDDLQAVERLIRSRGDDPGPRRGPVDA